MSGEPRVFRGLRLPPGSAESLGDRGGEVFVERVEQGGGPYDVHVFLNNPEAHAATERTAAHGYAGTIHVYGAGRPPGAPGHPVDRRLDITAALKRAASRSDDLTVTLVPVVDGGRPSERTLEDADVSVSIRQ